MLIADKCGRLLLTINGEGYHINLSEVNLDHVDMKPLDEILDSEEFKREVDSYKVDKCYLSGNSILKIDLIEYRRNFLLNDKIRN